MKCFCALAVLLALMGCEGESESESAAPATQPGGGGEVVIYSSIDEPYLRPLMQKFQTETGITVRIVTDTEATKSAGLVERLIAEKDRPQADVYWGNEIFHTINLAGQGLLAPYRPATAEDVPVKWRGAGDLFTGVGLRARMIVVSARPEHKGELTSGILGLDDLARPALKGRIAISNPAFGTASGHVAAMYTLWGEAKFIAYMNALKANDVKLLGGNSTVVTQTGAGTIVAGLTDNDDVNNARAEGLPVDGILPDQAERAIGTLLIPGTVALMKNAQHEASARKLIDFICRPEVEQGLIDGLYLACSVRNSGNVKAMNVDYPQVARNMKKAVELSLNILQDRNGSAGSAGRP